MIQKLEKGIFPHKLNLNIFSSVEFHILELNKYVNIGPFELIVIDTTYPLLEVVAATICSPWEVLMLGGSVERFYL